MNIRSVSLAILRKEDRILVQEINFPDISTTFYRPIGGTIEFGENSKKTLIRELKEELDQEIEEPRLISVIENIFGIEDELGHEIDFIYEASFIDKSQYNQEEFVGLEGSIRYKACWKPITYFSTTMDDVKLVPDGLLDLLLEKELENGSMVRHIRTK
ncbi:MULTISPECIES: NUDIX hydrolase [unclassified Paenibacillus]|uniref:NUDIX hydrolase n=1 Tax=unclassified Paenibacillus TaxID=185978 RepID=UPI0008D3CB64|nr:MULTISPECIES: NUDIX domain-containing protein [unclassified Paenibacillus]QLG38936.1 NUDIX domain-containing protein [Paenibacillus sp. E222]SEO83295.1 NUDIX domain-containing protein [Paenibacillus sp. OK076]